MKIHLGTNLLQVAVFMGRISKADIGIARHLLVLNFKNKFPAVWALILCRRRIDRHDPRKSLSYFLNRA